MSAKTAGPQGHREMPCEADSPAAAAAVDEQDDLHALLENVPAVVLRVAPDGRILFANRTSLGIPVAEIVGRNLYDFPAPAEEHQKVRDAIARAVQTGAAVEYEGCLHWPPGSISWFTCRIGPILRDGQVVALALVATDITQRKVVERALQESEQRFRRIAEQSPDVIFRLGVNGLEYINPAMEAMLGRRPSDRLTSTTMSPQHLHPDELARVPDIIAELDRGPARYELRMIHKDGHTVWTEHHLVPILSPSGKRIGVEGIIRDISQRKEAEAALQRVHRELEVRVAQRTAELARANEALRTEIGERMRAQEQVRQHHAALAHALRVSTMGEMAAGLAHEINQPLGAIANFANGIAARLRAGIIQPEALLVAAEQAAAEALRAGEVIRRLRDFVRRDDSKREAADVNGLVREAAHLIEPEARRASITIRLALDARLPEAEVDAIQIEQVMLNLMRNGLEAMAASAAPDHELLIETALVGDRTAIEVRVRDTGPGIAPDVAGRIFDAFVTTKASGLGMGLSISRSLVEDHGGELWMRANPGRGATFGFRLPVTREPRVARLFA